MRSDLPSTYALGAAIGRVPARLVVLTVDAADVGHGVGLSPGSPPRSPLR